ncbi:MAG: TonB-dependent receptor [Spirochaetota bacterium]|nr:TonB-dependent receptor [Spirochaetota bacterium]
MKDRFANMSIYLILVFTISILHTCILPLYSQSDKNNLNNEVEGRGTNDLDEKSESDSIDNDRTDTRDERISEDIKLRTITVKGSSSNRDEKRDIQKLSSHTMTLQELKNVPASLGDSINALTSLPGIIRAGEGLFGPLVIRGANIRFNNYYIDDIPIYNPLHYGGMHSIINNNLINKIDLYASSFPVEFGSALAAVIDISTIDEVDEFGGYINISALSADALIQSPILRVEDEGLVFGSPINISDNAGFENIGYFIVSGRYGYIGLLIPHLMPKEEKDKIEIVPEYWDYQTKCKYNFNSTNSLTLLLIGSSDYFKIKKKRSLEEGEDPLQARLEFKMDQVSHGQGIYYTYKPSKKMSNELIAYSSFHKSFRYMNFPEEGIADWAKNVHVTSRSYIFGFKDNNRFEWWQHHGEVDAGIEHTIYYFTAHGKTILPQGYYSIIDLSDPNMMISYYLDERIVNHVTSGYLKNRFTLGRFILLPGIRSDYLSRSAKATWDPRIMASYEFPTRTTLSAAGGKYSFFLQTNPIIFDTSPDLTKLGDELMSEKAIHRALGVEQKIDLVTLKIEGFYNNFYDLAEAYPHIEPDGTYLQGLTSGKAKAKGVEIMLRKDRVLKRRGLFGWLSYTYTHSKYKSGLPTQPGLYGNPSNRIGDEYGDQWINYDFEQRHSLKLVTGYVFGNHTFSARFQFYSSFPYTPIIGSNLDIEYYFRTGLLRYQPITGKRNTAHFPSHHTLDIRYSYRNFYSWGHVSWYIEVINVYNNRAINEHNWDYRYEYGPNNPHNKAPEDNFMQGIIPNFGVEIKF